MEIDMRVRTLVPAALLVFVSTVVMLRVDIAGVQAPARGAARPAPSTTSATVLQVMRGILYPSSNVVFYAQADDPEAVPKPPDPSTAPNLLASTYGGWEAVANASLALTESARLLEVPRTCSNGKPAPI